VSVKVARRLRYAILFLVGFASLIFFGVISYCVNAQPSTNAFQGWVAVVQPSTDFGADGVQLDAEGVDPGAPGLTPTVRYSALVCGDRPFKGWLIIGGDARFGNRPSILGPRSDAPAAIEEVPDLILDDVGSGETWGLGPVQVVELKVMPETPCNAGQLPDQRLLAVTGVSVEGEIRAPIQHRVTFLGLDGPRQSQVWPLIGRFPGPPSGFLGEFRGHSGLPGSWSIPRLAHTQVNGGGLTARATVDLAQPPLTESSSLTWNSAGPLQATARLTDVESMQTWQSWLVAAGISLGIGGALLASLLIEWAQKNPEESKPSSSPPRGASRTTGPADFGRRSASAETPSLFFLVLVFAIAALRFRRRP
jgi:hypothetical protein